MSWRPEYDADGNLIDPTAPIRPGAGPGTGGTTPVPPGPTVSEVYLSFPNAHTSASGRVWSAGEPYVQGSPTVYALDPGRYPPNDVTLIGLEAGDEVMFQERNVIGGIAPLTVLRSSIEPGQYRLKIWFSEGYFTAAGDRIIQNIVANGVTFAVGLDIGATALARTGSIDGAILIEQDVSVGQDGTLTVQINPTAGTGNAFIGLMALVPRVGAPATYIVRNVGVDAADQPFNFTDSNGLAWEADKDWVVSPDTRGSWQPINPIVNLEEFGLTSADNPLFQARRVGFNKDAGNTLRWMEYNVTIEGGYRYQIGFATHEQYGADRQTRVLWNGQQVVAPIPATLDDHIATGFGWLDLKALSGPQVGVLRFEDDFRDTDNNPIVCGFWVIEETVEPPGRITHLRVNTGGDATRDFTTSAGVVWVEDVPYLDPSVVETQRYTLTAPVTGLADVGLTAADAGLVQDLRYSISVPLKFEFELENGFEWCLKLLMIEDAATGNTIGSRVMDIYANGVQIAAGLDPLALASGVYHHVVTHQCALVDLKSLTGDFTSVDVEIRQAAGASGPEPYPMVAGLEWTRLTLAAVRERIVDDTGTPRANQSGLYVFVWAIAQLDPLIVQDIIASRTGNGTTDADGYLSIDMPAGVAPGTRVIMGVSNAADADDLVQWSFFGSVLTRAK